MRWRIRIGVGVKVGTGFVLFLLIYLYALVGGLLLNVGSLSPIARLRLLVFASLSCIFLAIVIYVHAFRRVGVELKHFVKYLAEAMGVVIRVASTSFVFACSVGISITILVLAIQVALGCAKPSLYLIRVYIFRGLIYSMILISPVVMLAIIRERVSKLSRSTLYMMMGATVIGAALYAIFTVLLSASSSDFKARELSSASTLTAIYGLALASTMFIIASIATATLITVENRRVEGFSPSGER